MISRGGKRFSGRMRNWTKFVGNQPSMALHIITEILAATDNKFVLPNLAAGPLEDLLCLHGSSVIDGIERLAEIGCAFSELTQRCLAKRNR